MGNAQKRLGLASSKKGRDETKAPASKHETEAVVKEIAEKGSIEDFYEVHNNVVLGRGHYAIVNLGINRKTGIQVAVKRIQISKSRYEALEREVQVLRKVGQHPNIVTLYDIFITETELQLVLELLQGGELFDRMVERGPYSEQEASYHIGRIGRALQYLHANGIVHRDLKPENLILASRADDSELKIADFGLSKIVDDAANATMGTVCGTWAYCAPEVKTSLKDSNTKGQACYTAAVDLWSVGVILFVILGAYHPFDPDGDASDAQLWENICKGEFDFNDPAWEPISAQAKDLIKKLIVIDPKRRFTTEQLLAHPWVEQRFNVPATPITPSIDKSLSQFRHRRGPIGMAPQTPMQYQMPSMQLGNNIMNMQQQQLHMQQHMQQQHMQQQFHPPQQIHPPPQINLNGGQRNFQNGDNPMVVENRVDAYCPQNLPAANQFVESSTMDDYGEAPPLPSLTLNTLVRNDDSMDITN
mmetsp:Transcript_4118/g.4768  ORF Transcript_4118/g.4768 Transcript_4118/m.4768 type:complete len:473 (+) Transcript_4118:374-1792(+)